MVAGGIAYAAPSGSWVLPVLLLAVAGALAWAGAGVVRWQPLLPLGGALVLAGIALQRSLGIQVEEVVFAGYYLSYLLGWYTLRLLVYHEPLVWSGRDWGMAAFLIIVQVQTLWGLLSGAPLAHVQSDWQSFSMFLFYFPIREVVVRYDKGASLICFSVLFIGFVAFYRNVIETQTTIAAASYAWEIARVRVTANEFGMTAGAILSASLAVTALTKLRFGLYGLGFALLSVGVVLTQWRAYYVTLALSLALLSMTTTRQGRRRLVALGGIGTVLGLAALFLVLGDGLLLLLYGVLDRILSIGTAGQVDESLVNRFVETRAALDYVYRSPVIGYGLGSNFGFMDIIENITWIKNYAHNGYVSIWFKLGGVGLASLLWVWGAVLRDGWMLLRSGRPIPPAPRALCAASWCMLIGLIPSFAVSAPFVTSDTSLGFVLLAAGVAGVHDRYLASHTVHTEESA